MTYTIPFTQLNKNNISTAGGKGANLGELTTIGLPVPQGFVLMTEAYDIFVQAHGLQKQIVSWAVNASANDPQSSETASTQIQQLFWDADMLDEIASELVSAWQDLRKVPVAVRSSATAEDLPTASFAGQQDTYLNIQNEDALLDAVKKCWASLWTARAISYRQRQGIDPSSVSLAVVVQQLIPANSAGILFTANPMNGERGQIVINATWGLGEAIVGGLVTPDTVVMDKSNWQIVSRETTLKTVMTVRTEAGTEERAIPEAQQNEAVLDEKTAVELAWHGEKIEAHYGMPMDIEWAIVDGEISILQARPITSLPDPKPELLQNVVWEPVIPNTIWMRRQIVEHMPDPLSPLFEDLYLRKGLDKSIGQLIEVMAEMGSTELNWNEMLPQGLAATINGYAYTAGSFNMTGKNLIAILKIYASIYKFFRLSAFDWDGVVLPSYQATIARWSSIDLAEAADKELLEGISEMATADSAYWWGSALNLGFSRLLDPVFDLFLRSPLIRYALPESRPVSASFLRGFDSKALDAQEDMELLADMIRDSAEIRDLVLNTKVDQLIGVLSQNPDAQPVLAGIQQYLDRYGHQIYNLDFVDPTQNENPTPILLSLKALVTNPPAQDVRSRQAQMAAEREELVARTRRGRNPLSRVLFDWLWKSTKKYAPYRENVMFYMGAAWPTLRQLTHQLGQRLTDSVAITQPDDIYYLTSAEITAVIEARANSHPIPDYAQLVQERRSLREVRKLLTPLPTVPERGEMKFGPFKLSMFNPTPSDAVNEGPVLEGYAVSIGRVTAPASVIYSVEDFAKMEPGTILVCTTTTPAWTPLFSQAVGLVTDVGGALAHGSIVAREYGIPAVMGTGVATERIKSGVMLSVDGNAGTVTLVDEVDESADMQVMQEQTTSNVRKKALAALVIGVVVGFIWWKRRK
ncbi:MAG: hypothetical protein GY796_18755 [Chloroflexi bacterium]|nr:hypothetical protein [Chloroflexota bacterium]